MLDCRDETIGLVLSGTTIRAGGLETWTWGRFPVYRETAETIGGLA